MALRVLVTGGNSGIGLALCKQLVIENGCHVYLCSRNLEKGETAVHEIMNAMPEGCTGSVECVQLDTSSDESVLAAAAIVKEKVGDGKLYAVVNNAGTGFSHGVDAATVMNTNLYGPKRVTEAFLSLLHQTEGRVVNVGSGAAGGFVKGAPPEIQRKLCSTPESWAQIEDVAKSILGSEYDKQGGYGLSKACLAAYTMLCAAQTPNITWSCLSPGFLPRN